MLPLFHLRILFYLVLPTEFTILESSDTDLMNLSQFSHYIAANIVALIGVDFLHYWSHRWTHEVPVLWEFHKIHHNSEYHNLFSANRNTSVIEFLFVPFFSLLALFLPTEQFILHKTLNDIYPWWLHTTIIPKLGPLELFASTPSNHRVHHARNKEYIDRNFGNGLIVWDRIFGTYQEELDSIEIEYGTTTVVKSYNTVWMEAQWVRAITFTILGIPWKENKNNCDSEKHTKGPRFGVKSTLKQKIIVLLQFAIVALAVKIMHTNKFVIGSMPSFLCTAALLYHFGYLMDYNETLSKEGDILNRFGLMAVVLLVCLWPAAIHFVVFLSVCAVHISPMDKTPLFYI